MSRHSSRGRPWERTRKRILERDGYRCRVPDPHVCTVVADQVDHIVRRQHGGTDDDHNLRAACANGNRAREAKVPALDTGGHW